MRMITPLLRNHFSFKIWLFCEKDEQGISFCQSICQKCYCNMRHETQQLGQEDPAEVHNRYCIFTSWISPRPQKHFTVLFSNELYKVGGIQARVAEGAEGMFSAVFCSQFIWIILIIVQMNLAISWLQRYSFKCDREREWRTEGKNASFTGLTSRWYHWVFLQFLRK